MTGPWRQFFTFFGPWRWFFSFHLNFTEFPNNGQLDSFGVGQTGYAISDVEFVQFSVGRFAILA